MKWILQLCLAFFLLLPQISFASQDDNMAFRDFYWGESLEEVQQTRMTKRIGHNSTYNWEYYTASFKDGESHYLMGYPIIEDGFCVAFWNDKLFMVGSLFEDREEYHRGIFGSMVKRYGFPEYDEKNDQYCWFHKEIEYILTNKKVPGYFMVAIMNLGVLTDTFGTEKANQGW